MLLTTGILLLGGCASVTDNIVINSNGEVLRDIEIVVEENDNTIGAALAHDEIYKQGEEQGFEVDYNELENGQSVYHLRKVLENVDPNNISISYHQALFDKNSQNMVKPEVLTITKKENVFKKQYITDSNFKVTALEQLEDVDYKLKLHLPIDPNNGENNASEKDGNTLTWKANKDHVVDAKFDITSFKLMAILSIGVGALLVLNLLCLGALRLLRGKETEDELIHRRLPKSQYQKYKQ